MPVKMENIEIQTDMEKELSKIETEIQYHKNQLQSLLFRKNLLSQRKDLHPSIQAP